MDNFTPLKAVKKKRKFNKFLIFGNLFLVVLIAAIGFFYYNKTLQTTEQKAVGVSCKSITDKDECNADYSCSPPKGKDDKQYKCKWDIKDEKCEESGQVCGEDGGGGYGCPAGSYQSGCKDHQKDNGVWVCDCYINGSTLGCTEPEGYAICPDSLPQNCVGSYICGTNPTEPPIHTPTPTPTTPVATNTPTPTPPAATNTPTPTRTPTPTPTKTPTPTRTPTPTPTPTGTIAPSNTPTVTPTTPPGQPTNTPVPSATITPTDVPGAPTATPTEIILAQTTVTNPPVPVTGMLQSFMYLIPAIIILIGLIL